MQFLPQSGDNIVASSAADCKIHVHDVTSHEVLHVFGCHAGRVKRLATSPSQPNVFWSASEDGTIMWENYYNPGSVSYCQSVAICSNVNVNVPCIQLVFTALTHVTENHHLALSFN